MSRRAGAAVADAGPHQHVADIASSDENFSACPRSSEADSLSVLQATAAHGLCANERSLHRVRLDRQRSMR